MQGGGRVGPGIDGSGPGAIALNSDVVGASADAEETIFTPVGTPGVSDEPIFVAILNTVTNDADVMDDFHITGIITVDTTSVVIESLRDGDTTSEGTSLVDLLHHGLFSADGTVFINTIGVISIGDEASLTGVAVTAHGHSRAAKTIVATASLVRRASLIGDVVLVDPLESAQGVSTVATISILLTRDEDLRSDVDLGPSTVTGNLDSVSKGGGGSLSPA